MKPKEVPAPIFKRLFAFVIDILIVDLVLLWPFSRVLSALFENSISAEAMADLISGQPYIIFSVTIIFFLYFVLFEYKTGQTIGKMLVNLYCTPVAGEMRLWQAVVRNIFLIPAVPFIFLWVIDPIYILWRNQSLSEILTKTRTVEQKVVNWQQWIIRK
ncbi:RDD family protein [Candidatus Woesearchaeota archaeon]|nr:RDD family protein [Candidatus Woesearchaeota archaeon]